MDQILIAAIIALKDRFETPSKNAEEDFYRRHGHIHGNFNSSLLRALMSFVKAPFIRAMAWTAKRRACSGNAETAQDSGRYCISFEERSIEDGLKVRSLIRQIL
ncbi:hypothetical protein [Oryzifoliimicrobium ureilyticus]|uniref:hypothetical protein n=1 Tax=Oryzifoliimicrobium ureilyticus TaxID=3113724 RepID=UPI003075FC84